MLDLGVDSGPKSDSGVIQGGMFLASVVIGVTPAVAAAGFMLGGGTLAMAGSGCLLIAGLVTAVLSADHSADA